MTVGIKHGACDGGMVMNAADIMVVGVMHIVSDAALFPQSICPMMQFWWALYFFFFFFFLLQS